MIQTTRVLNQKWRGLENDEISTCDFLFLVNSTSLCEKHHLFLFLPFALEMLPLILLYSKFTTHGIGLTMAEVSKFSWEVFSFQYALSFWARAFIVNLKKKKKRNKHVNAKNLLNNFVIFKMLPLNGNQPFRIFSIGLNIYTSSN